MTWADVAGANAVRPRASDATGHRVAGDAAPRRPPAPAGLTSRISDKTYALVVSADMIDRETTKAMAHLKAGREAEFLLSMVVVEALHAAQRQIRTDLEAELGRPPTSRLTPTARPSRSRGRSRKPRGESAARLGQVYGPRVPDPPHSVPPASQRAPAARATTGNGGARAGGTDSEPAPDGSLFGGRGAGFAPRLPNIDLSGLAAAAHIQIRSGRQPLKRRRRMVDRGEVELGQITDAEVSTTDDTETDALAMEVDPGPSSSARTLSRRGPALSLHWSAGPAASSAARSESGPARHVSPTAHTSTSASAAASAVGPANHPSSAQ